MRHECFSQIGSRKTDSDIYGANSWVSVREFGGSVRELGVSVREHPVSRRELGVSRREHPVSGHEFPVSGYKLGVPRVCLRILRRKLGGRSIAYVLRRKKQFFICVRNNEARVFFANRFS